jgi:poly(A) polymerase
VRFVEDPVRMFRAAVFGARLGFDLDPLVVEAIAEHRRLITDASPARLMEEYFKVLRSGFAEATFRALDRLRLLESITPELAGAPDAVWDALARLDRYRQRFTSAPPELTNTVLIGALLIPLGLLRRPSALNETRVDPRSDRLSFGALPVPRRDLERLRQLVQTVPRLLDPNLPPRVARGLPHRPAFPDSLTWLDIFEDAPDLVERWRHQRSQRQPHVGGAAGPHAGAHDAGELHDAPPDADAAPLPRRRRRRRRRRGRRQPHGPSVDGNR